jgi:hypothetical protein
LDFAWKFWNVGTVGGASNGIGFAGICTLGGCIGICTLGGCTGFGAVGAVASEPRLA